MKVFPSEMMNQFRTIREADTKILHFALCIMH